MIRSISRVVRLDRKGLPCIEEAAADHESKRNGLEELMSSGAAEAEITDARVEELYDRLLVERIRERTEEEPGTPIEIEVQGFRIGSALLLAVPVELFVSIGLRLKGVSRFGRTSICGYGNGSYGYVPSAGAFAEGGYEAVSSRFARASAAAIESSLLSLADEL